MHLLGPVSVVGARGPVEPSKRGSLTELAALLALFLGRGHASIDEAIWPGRRISDNTRNTAMSNLRRWLGRDSGEADYLPRLQVGTGYRLADAVTTDWRIWQRLVGTDPWAASTRALEEALGLVRGRPFEGVPAHRYGWADMARQEMITSIVATSHELALRRLALRDWRGAETAAVVGLSVEPGMERLWRARLLAARSSGNVGETQDVVRRMLVIVEALGGELKDQTRRLLAGLRCEPWATPPPCS